MIQLGSVGEDVRRLQWFLGTTADGVFGPGTETALKAFQKRCGLVADGIVGPATRTALGWDRVELEPIETGWALPSPIPKKFRNLANSIKNLGTLVDRAATNLMVDVCDLHAVIAVESAGKAFENNKPIIRFENHVFYRRWGKYNKELYDQHFKHSASTPWLGHQVNTGSGWVEAHQNQKQEHQVLAFACKLNSEDAYCSTSFGAPQIMGFHYLRLGFNSAEEFATAMWKDKETQIEALVKFIQTDTELLTALQEKDYYEFARIYNGSGQTSFYGALIETNSRQAEEWKL